MSQMFWNAKSFNQDINTKTIEKNEKRYLSWNVSYVLNMSSMFENAEKFNSDLSKWSTINVNNMVKMFKNAKAFNKTISNFNINNVTDFTNMFENATSFNQDLSNWIFYKKMKFDSYDLGANLWKESFKPKTEEELKWIKEFKEEFDRFDKALTDELNEWAQPSAIKDQIDKQVEKDEIEDDFIDDIRVFSPNTDKENADWAKPSEIKNKIEALIDKEEEQDFSTDFNKFNDALTDELNKWKEEESKVKTEIDILVDQEEFIDELKDLTPNTDKEKRQWVERKISKKQLEKSSDLTKLIFDEEFSNLSKQALNRYYHHINMHTKAASDLTGELFKDRIINTNKKPTVNTNTNINTIDKQIDKKVDKVAIGLYSIITILAITSGILLILKKRNN
ncbi:BspA family leucine-rich repeat surface protein [Mycoplasma feriruminatoris]|uniref:BspA family leucine-rich repeat surface protein n=1 Tax=Mycoplasma feriruminatoris TaxID=1179777 RepID=UPI0002A4F91C|nr:BspA family leucine-rich repeat surface protein [Mycoplasma feriruminatoris]UKS54088.1 hypothetical protein D500_00440 [Mycoplasma feriruminatoris]VZS00147.1 hypothetical protein MF5582_00450 [Mycoplasma feriruminatoris]